MIGDVVFLKFNAVINILRVDIAISVIMLFVFFLINKKLKMTRHS